MKLMLLGALALLAGGSAVPAAAKTAEEIRQDREIIRRMNQNELARVRARDARYAEQNRTSRTSRADLADYADRRAAYARDMADYRQQRRDYRARMAQWRADVAACERGDYSACAR